MGCGDDAHIATDRLVVTHPLEDPLLQDPQQLDLHRQTHVADFVEKQRAPFSDLEAAPTGGVRPGEGAFFVTEQFAL